MSDGVLYMLAGSQRAAQLTVSLYSLRQQWEGHVVVVACDDDALQFCSKLKDDPRIGIDVVRWDPPEGTRGKGGWQACKPEVALYSPFRRTVFLDTDTLVVGPFNELWCQGDEVRLTRFSNWVTTGSKISGRIRGWAHVLPDEVDEQLSKPYPALNTGTFGISNNCSEFIEDWLETTRRNVCFMCDELAAQLVFPRHSHLILDHRWNFSPKYSLEPDMLVWDKADARIVHFHGWSHCRPHKTQFGCDLWVPWYLAACKENWGGIGDWGPGRDKKLRAHLDELQMPEGLMASQS